MKKILHLLILGFMLPMATANGQTKSQMAPNVQSDQITLHSDNHTLEDVFALIETNTPYTFAYNSHKVPVKKKVNVSVENGTVQDALAQLANQCDVRFEVINNRNIAVTTTGRKTVVADKNGALKGNVTDAKTGEALPGAAIRIEELNGGTATNLDGSFYLSLPAGTYNITVKYIGYNPSSQQITVTAENTVNVSIELTSQTFDLNDFEVVGMLEGQQKAFNQQKNAINIKNVVSTDQIGRFPDSNTAEALQRIPGINIDRESGDGEGRYVGLRGLPPYFANISINGEQTPSPEGDTRQTALDAIPADQLASIEVTKAITPDMDGDAIGGNINLITRSATSRNMRIVGNLGTEVQQNNPGQPGVQASFQIGQRFGGDKDGPGKFGALVNASFYRSNRNVDQVENDYDTDVDGVEWEGFELEDAFFIRNRLGISGAFDYKPNNNTTFYLNTLYTQLYELDESRRLGYDVLDPGYYREIKHRQENQGIQSYNLGARHNLPGIAIDYEASISLGNQNTPYEYLPVFGLEDDNLVITTDRTDVDFPQVTGATLNGAPLDLADGENFRLVEYEYSGTSAQSRNTTGRINFELPVAFGKNTGSIKFGGKYRSSWREHRNDFYNLWEYAGPGDAPSMNTSGFTTGGNNFDPILFNGTYDLGTSIEYQNIFNFIQDNQSDFEDVGIEEEPIEIAERDYELTENVYAGYAMATINFNKLTVLGGVRYEGTTIDTQTQFWDFDNEVSVPISGKNDYGFLLPMVHFKYVLNPATNFRLAMTSTYARPNFSDIVSDDKGIDRQDQEAFIGNLELDPVRAGNFDFLVEHYFGTVGVLSGGIFYKRLDDFIYTRVTRQEFLGVPDIDVYQSVNGGRADVYGLELAYQQNLTFLPGFFKDFGLFVNYTHAQSQATFTDRAGRFDEEGNRITTEEISQLPGQSEHVFNGALFYQKKGFQARIAANFNSEFISDVGANSITDEFVDSRWQFDASVSQRISKYFTGYVEAVNLTNSYGRTFLGTTGNPIAVRSFGFWARVGVRFDISRR